MIVDGKKQSARCVEQERKIGGLEYIFRESVAVTAFTLRGAVDHSVLKEALQKVVLENPLLACRIEQQGGNYYFCHDPDNRLVLSTIKADAAVSLATLVEDEMSEKFECGERLFRCRLICGADAESCVLLASFSHAIYDGTSLGYFINTLLAAYQQIDTGERSAAAVTISPSYEEYIQHRKSLQDFIRFARREAAVRLKKRAVFPIHTSVPVEERVTKTIYRRLTAEETVNIARASRKARTTANGAIMAAMLFAIAGRLPENRHAFSLVNNINMRSKYKIPNEQMGVYVSVISSMVAVDKDVDFWQLAVKCRKDLSSDVKNDLPDTVAAFCCPIIKYTPAFFEKKIKDGSTMGRMNTLCISDLGTIKVAQRPIGFTVEDIVSNVGIHEVGSDFGLIPLTYNGRTGFNLHYVQPLITDAEAEVVMTDFLKLLDRCTGEKEFWPLKS